MLVLDEDTLRLRAERDETRSGRVYTITYRVTDDCGNSATDSATVTVPLGPAAQPPAGPAPGVGRSLAAGLRARRQRDRGDPR